MYTLDPAQPNQELRLVTQLSGIIALTRIAEVLLDVFAVTGGMLSILAFCSVRETSRVFLVDFRRCIGTNDKTTVQHLASIPDALILNGIVSLPVHPHIVLSIE